MSENGTFWLPEASSTIAGEVDSLFYFIYWICVVSFILVVGATFLFAWKYRRRPGGPEVKQFTHGIWLEISWSTIPGIILMVMFAWGAKDYMKMAIAPGDAMEIRVVGKKWSWEFLYPNGKVSPGELVVPVNKPVKLIMSSQDVIHSFYIPEFRVKADVLPGRYTTLWFEAINTGDKHVFCAEYCGDDHSRMLATVKVVTDEEYEKWSNYDPYEGLSLLDIGKSVYEKNACAGCHSLDGAAGVGPTFKGLYGKSEPLTDGTSVTVDDNYIRQSVMDPASQVVQGYAPVMPAFPNLKEKELAGLIEYIKTTK